MYVLLITDEDWSRVVRRFDVLGEHQRAVGQHHVLAGLQLAQHRARLHALLHTLGQVQRAQTFLETFQWIVRPQLSFC
jgi:hypothetical protein